jgi:hypothetical protein
MISEDEVQMVLTSILKTNPTVIGLLPEGASGIKEYQWQGTNFKYPAIRVQLHPQKPYPEETNCEKYLQPWSYLILSEQKSSKEASAIMGAVLQAVYKHNYVVSGVALPFVHLDSMIPPIRRDVMTWRAELSLHSAIYKK